jgi:carboxyl-terminal processing protease
MIELLAAVALLGVTGALLMPRLAPEKTGYVGIGALIEKPRHSLAYAWIARSFPNSPAERAGLRYGDLILRVDGASMLHESLESLGNRCMGGPVGSPVQITILRDDHEVDLTLHRQWIALPEGDERTWVDSDRLPFPSGL